MIDQSDSIVVEKMEEEIENGSVYIHLETQAVLEITSKASQLISSQMNSVSVSQTLSDIEQFCGNRQEYSSWYLTILVILITIGLTASLFILTIIGWFPDLSSSSKHVCQAYSLLSNMVSILAAGFVILSTFVPTPNACSVSLVLVHLSLFMFVTSDLLLHLDFYLAIVAPFWHEEVIAASETISPAICAACMALSIGSTAVLFFLGPFWCPEVKDPKRRHLDCPIVVIMNLTRDGSITTFINMCVASLFSLVLASSCHVFIIALQKLKANSVAPAAANSSSDDELAPALDTKVDPKCLGSFKITFLDCKLGFGPQTTLIAVQPNDLKDGQSGVNDPSSTTDSEAPLAEGSGNNDGKDSKEREGKGKGGAGGGGEELGRALTKSFRYNLINILTYGFFMLPSLGLGLETSGYPNIWGPLDFILSGENGVFLAEWAWKFSLLLFMVFRTALPIVMAKTDKALLSKINVIISDDVED